MSEDEEKVLIKLAGKVGNLEGGFSVLKDYIELQTKGCRTNYEDLKESFVEVRKDINGKIEEDKINKAEQNAVGKAKVCFRKIMESRVTLICVIVMALAATVTVMRGGKKPEMVSSHVNIAEQRLANLITALESRLDLKPGLIDEEQKTVNAEVQRKKDQR